MHEKYLRAKMFESNHTKRLFSYLVFISLSFALGSQSFGATITAADTSSAAVQAAINAANTGDTVLVPAGSATWSTAVTLAKGIRLIGAGIGNTVISQNGSARMLNISGSSAFTQVSGFSFIEAGPNNASSGFITCAGGNWRFCSNYLSVASGGAGIVCWGTDSISALIDRNTVVAAGSGNTHFVLFWGNTGDAGASAWTRGTTYGTTNYVYVEHNNVTFNALQDGAFDAYAGAKFVIRYNNLTNVYFGWHGADSGGWRSPHSYEIYGNRFIYNNGGYYCVFNSRGGTGLMFSNSVTGRTDGGSAIKLQYFRASTSYAPWGQMTGSNPYDGNEDGTGYPGLDQQGMTGPTTWFSDHSVQVHSPTYIWGNTGGFAVGADSNIKAGRDYMTTALVGYIPLVDPHPLAGGVQAPDTNPPSITTQPKNTAVATGQTATFSTGAIGGGTLAYQWRWHGTNVTGATSSSWTTPATGLGNSNSVVSVSVGSAYGSVTSSNAYLSVTNGVAPTITTQPTSRANGVGDSTTFAVIASGTAPLTYRWWFNSAAIVGATGSSYTLAPVATNNAGSYTVVVTNSYGSVTSAVAVLTVTASTQAVRYFYVAPTGSDSSGNGSIGSPWATLEGATSKMRGGDVLYVRGGNYSEVFDLYGPNGINASYPTVIQAYPGETPIFNHNDTSSSGNSLNGLNWYVINGLTIINYQCAMYVWAGCGNVTLTNLTIYNTGQESLHVSQNSHDILLVNNLIHDAGLGGSYGEGFYIGSGDSPGFMDNTHNITLRGNTVYNTLGEGIEVKPGTYNVTVESNLVHTSNKAQVSSGAGGGAIEVNEGGTYNYWTGNPNHIIRGNTVYDTPIGIRAGNGGQYYNNIIYNATTYGILVNNNDGNPYIRYIYNNTIDLPSSIALVRSAGTASILNNIGPTGTYNLATSSGYYVNAAAHNYRLVVGSAPINAGTNLFGVLATDFDGNARPSAGAFDIGAYEYGGVVGPSPLAITTSSLPNGTTNTAYTVALIANGGALPYTWSLVSGSLPPGLTLNGASGAISGTPTTLGTYSVTIRVSDSSSPIQSVTKALPITVNSKATVIGNKSDGAFTDPISSWINASRFQASNDLPVNTISAKVTAIVGKYKCAIYSDSNGQPGSLLRVTSEASCPIASWRFFPLTSSVVLNAGQYYWLAIWSDDANAQVYHTDTAGTLRWGEYTYGSWPEPFTTIGGASLNFCIYATGATVPPPPSSLTILGSISP